MLLTVALYACDTSRTIKSNQIEIIDDKYYVKGENEPYTGKIADSLYIELLNSTVYYSVHPNFINGEMETDTLKSYMLHDRGTDTAFYLMTITPRLKSKRNGKRQMWGYEFVDWYEADVMAYEHYRNDSLDGYARTFNLVRNGKCRGQNLFYLARETFYKDDRAEGEFHEYFQHCDNDNLNDFIKAKGRYVNGLREGKWISNQMVKDRVVPFIEQNFAKNEYNGDYKVWRESNVRGKLVFLSENKHYYKGVRHGTAYTYHDYILKDHVKSIAEYDNGILHGKFEEYNKYGLIRRRVYEDGNLVFDKRYIAR